MSKHKVIFLDRDGTINVDRARVYRVSDWEFVEGAILGLKQLQQADYKLAVVTNQTGIGAGYYTLEDMHALHDHMQAELKKNGVHIDAIAFCSHSPDEACECRKPSTGMVQEIEEQLGAIDYAQSWTIGDKEHDALFGTKIGTSVALIRSSYWNEDRLSVRPDLIVRSLGEFAKTIAQP